MKITYDLLVKHKACNSQREAFKVLYPDGCEPTVKNLFDLAAEGLDAWWLWHVLPAEGPGSQRAYALWCAEEVAHLTTDKRVADCLKVVRRQVEFQDVTAEQMAAADDAADDAAWTAAGAAAGDAAWAAAGDAAWAAAGAAAGAAAWAKYLGWLHALPGIVP